MLDPLWRRILLVAFCAGWSAFEFLTNSPFWGTLAIAMTAYGAWQFLYVYKPVDPAAGHPVTRSRPMSKLLLKTKPGTGLSPTSTPRPPAGPMSASTSIG